MERQVEQIEGDIEKCQQVRDEALDLFRLASQQLCELKAERVRALGESVTKQLFLTPDNEEDIEQEWPGQNRVNNSG